jgi:hypothetical protein
MAEAQRMRGNLLEPTPIVIVERFWPGVTLEGLRVSGLESAGRGLDSLGSIVVLADELVLSLFKGSAVDDVAVLSRRSRLPFVRVVPATLLQSTVVGSPGAPAEAMDR